MASPIIIVDSTIDAEAARLLAAVADVAVADTNALDETQAAAIEALCIRTNTIIDEKLLNRMPSLRIVATATTGTNHVDKVACERRSVQVIDAKGANADSVADYVFRMLFAATDDALYTNERLKSNPNAFNAIKKGNVRKEIASMTIGIIGLGNIGTRVAKRAAAFGMQVKAYDPYVEAAHNTLAEVLTCDVVTIHAELTDETCGMIGRRELALLKDDAIFINAARGEIVKEEALIKRLQRHPHMKAIVDVFAAEPAPSQLYTLANCLVTPHIAGNAQEAKKRAAQMIAERIVASMEEMQVPLVVLEEARA